MPGTTIAGSVNLSLLDEKFTADLCAGEIIIDISPSIFLGVSGASNVLGVKVKVVNPAGATIKDYGVSYDATPASSGGVIAPISVTFPTKGGKYQYGVYTVSVELTDANGTKDYVTKSQNVCAYPDDVNSCIDSVQMVANCQSGKLTILMAEPPTYQGKIFQSKTQDWTLYYPTASGLTSIHSTISNFDAYLFEGVYKLTGSVCVTYAMGDNIFISIGSTGSWEKDVKCVLDFTCIYPKLIKLNNNLKNCSEAEKSDTSDIIFDVLRLLTVINITLSSGEDASDYITELEKLLGCSCTCECNASSPVINNAPAGSVVIDGCNVVKTTVGLTDHYQIENYAYIVSVDPTQSIISISAPSLTSCVKTQQLSINVAALYAAMKTQINSPSEYNYWASILSLSIDSLNPANIGLTLMEWQALSFGGKIQALIAADGGGSGSCTASVTATVASSGINAVFTLAISNAYNLDIYADNVLRGTVLASATSFTLNGFADGNAHTYQLVPRCSSGQAGSALNGNFTFAGCPDIQPLNVTSNNISGATCPYSLTSNIVSLPVGITAEWHTANNTLPGTLVSNAASVNSGVYYGFAKNSSGCFSLSVQVQVVCAAVSPCSAPQNLTLARISGTTLVQFDSAAFPPPANSYTVKRRRTSDPDISGSYTTIGTPGFNSGSGKWEISDSSPIAFTLYSYLAQSNCGGTTPSVQNNFGFAASESIVVTPASDRFHLSVGGSALPTHQVQFDLLNGAGTVQLDTVTLNTGVSTVTGDFFYLTPGTNYRIRIRRYLSGYLVDDMGTTTYVTDPLSTIYMYGPVVGQTFVSIAFPVAYTVVSGNSFPLTYGQVQTGSINGFTGVVTIVITGSPTSYPNSYCTFYVDGVLVGTLTTTTPGTYSFPSTTVLPGQHIDITNIN